MRLFDSRSGRKDARHLLRLAWISNVAPPAAEQTDASIAPVTGERLFDALDGYTIRVFQKTWRINVYSIWEENGFRWLQLSLEGETPYTATLQMSPLTGADQTVRRLSAWLARPSKTHHILSVA